MNKRILIVLTTAVLMSIASIQAQTNGSNSPYSYYGVGLLNDRVGTLATSMAGATTAVRDNSIVNPTNPASFSATDSLTCLFDIGLTLQNANLDESGRKVNAKNTSIDYVTLGFRIAPRLGLSVGLLPISTIGYKMKRTPPAQNVTAGEVTETDTYSGDGGLRNVYLGLGWEPLRGLSVGVSGGYVWGDMTHSISAKFSDTSAGTRSRKYETEIRSYKLDFGMQYEQPLGKNDIVTLGVRYGLGHTLNGTSTFTDAVTQNSTTMGDTLKLHNGYEFPHNFSVGLAWQHGKKLRISADYTLQKWGNVKSPVVGTTAEGAYSYTSATGAYNDMNRFSLGAEFIPMANHYNLRKHFSFRAGLAYTSPYIRVNGQDGPKHYLATLGVGIPIFNPNHSSRVIVLNIGGAFEHVKPSAGGMLKENYLRLNIGLSFNEQWFAKWKAL